MKRLTTYTLLGLFVLTQSSALSQENPDEQDFQEDYSDETSKKKVPKLRKLKESELSAEKDFQQFQQGPYFYPPLPHHQHFFGYEKRKDFFKDFKDDVLTENEEVSVCDGESNDEADGAVKLTFNCDDGAVEYSCYADLISNKYSVAIPYEVLGLTCSIQIEAVEATDDESDIEVDGVETEEEIELDSETEVTIDIEE